MSKSIYYREALRRGITYAALAVSAVLAAACGGSSAGASGGAQAPAPIVGDIERTTFAPSLGVHLDSMIRRSSGLYVQDLKFGTGLVAARTRTVVVRYTGWLPNGKQFESSEITVTLGSNKTIAAWEEGLLGMRVGGRRRLVVPPNMAYGSKGAGNLIPPNSVLVFEMEMISVF